jgi:hypothetical protein
LLEVLVRHVRKPARCRNSCGARDRRAGANTAKHPLVLPTILITTILIPTISRMTNTSATQTIGNQSTQNPLRVEHEKHVRRCGGDFSRPESPPDQLASKSVSRAGLNPNPGSSGNSYRGPSAV